MSDLPHDQNGARPLAPEMVRFRDALAAAYARHPSFAGLSPAAARAVAEAVRAPWAAGGPAMHSTRDLVIAAGGMTLRLRLHTPVPEPDGILVYAHGGGWTMFSLDTHDRLLREYAARGRLAVVGLDYSLAPEAVFPRAVGELAALLRLLRETGDVLGAGLGGLPVAVGGDSAGANLAMAATLLLRDTGGAPLPEAIVMNYAALDPAGDDPSYALYDGAGFNLTAAEMAGFWARYIPDPAMRASPLAALLRGSLRGLPPVFLAIAECDVLRDENLRLAAALRRDGVEADMVVYDGMLHSFLEAVSISPTADRALGETAAWLRDTLGLRPLFTGKDRDVRPR